MIDIKRRRGQSGNASGSVNMTFDSKWLPGNGFMVTLDVSNPLLKNSDGIDIIQCRAQWGGFEFGGLIVSICILFT